MLCNTNIVGYGSKKLHMTEKMHSVRHLVFAVFRQLTVNRLKILCIRQGYTHRFETSNMRLYIILSKR